MGLQFMLQFSCLFMVWISFGKTNPLHSARQISTAEPEKAKPVVFVVGADGFLGKMAIYALSAKHGKTLDIRVGVRVPGKAKSLRSLAGVTVYQAELGKKDRLRKLFKDVTSVFIISSDYGVGMRAELTIATAEAAKEAGAKHILIYSLVAAQRPDTIFGKQYSKIETAISKLNVPYTVLRLPILIANLLAHQDTIKNMSTIYWPLDPDAPFSGVVTGDASTAAAVILASPQRHAGKIYTIVSDRVTYNEIVEFFREALGRHVGYVRTSYEDTTAFLQTHDFSKNRAKAILELYRLIDARSNVTDQTNLNDYTQITGQNPTSTRSWIKKRAFLFK
ncbi:uncharacterized protein LOC114516919 [Dendronephthya gigantea]|uniref:uncharacterized protein LOC114516919 n=1 Tax=Dendronephthya gigantea TaxID=151771 RepID=UPI00106C0425|nr:uncharacterized protein LOC114516919 [Dendronephthya gigantea]